MSAAGVATRLTASAVLAALAGLALHENDRIRVFEAWLASHVIPIGARTHSTFNVGQPIVWFAVSATREVGLVITPECTVGLLMVPFIAASALLVWQRVPLIRPVVGLAAALVMLIAVNQLRLLDIVWFVHAMGWGNGFYWGHTLVGSLITIIGLASSLAVFVLVTVRRRKFVRG
jgi:exosortase/archaeosortase family protein